MNGQVSVALTTYVVAILLCSRRKDIDKQLLFTYTTSFLELQEQEIFLPAIRCLVMPSYYKLLALLETTYHAAEFKWSICRRMATIVNRLFCDEAVLCIWSSWPPRFRNHYESEFELGMGILGVIQQISDFLLRNYWARECDPRSLRLPGAFEFSKARIFHEFMDLDFGGGGDHHTLQAFQKEKQNI